MGLKSQLQLQYGSGCFHSEIKLEGGRGGMERNAEIVKSWPESREIEEKNRTFRADDKGRHRTRHVRRGTRGEDQILIVPFEEIYGDQSEQDETRPLQGTLRFLIAARILETGQSPPKLHTVNRPVGTPSPDNSFTWSKGLWWGSGGLGNYHP